MQGPLSKRVIKFINKRGGTLFETLLMSGLGIVLVLGLSKFIANFAEKSQNIASQSALHKVKSNVESVLKSAKAWGWATYENQKSCLPGNSGCPIILWHNPKNPPSKGKGFNGYNNPASVRVWACNLTSGGAIAYSNRSGTILALGNSSSVCGSCANAKDDLHCHLKRLGKDPKNFIRIKISPLSNYNASQGMVPPFKFDLEDYGLTKQKLSFDSVSEQTVFTPTGNLCPSGSLMTGYNDDIGTPTCRYPLTGGSCSGSSVVLGVNPDGSPRCGIPGKSNVSNSIAGGSCPSGSVVTRINNNGVPECVVAAKTGTCPAGTLATGFDANGVLTCAPYGGAPVVTPPPGPTPGPLVCPVSTTPRPVEDGDYTVSTHSPSRPNRLLEIKGLFSPRVEWDGCRSQNPDCRLTGMYSCFYHAECTFTIRGIRYPGCRSATPYVVDKTLDTTMHSTPYNYTKAIRDSYPLGHKCLMPPGPDKWRICKNMIMERDLYDYAKVEFKKAYPNKNFPGLDWNCITFDIKRWWHLRSTYWPSCIHKDSKACAELNRCDP